MRPDDLNFRHLLYFWTVAKEGSITRAAERLALSVQTISTQLGQLERQLGQVLLAPEGRSLVLTEAGRRVLVYAEQIFQLGDKLRQELAENPSTRPRLAVGITDTVPKLVAFHFLKRILQAPFFMRLECIEGNFEDLLSQLVLNRLDLMIADRSAPHRANLKLDSHLLAHVEIGLYAANALKSSLYEIDFPLRLNDAPLLLPTRGEPLRDAIDTWFAVRDLRPLVIGEFSDSALLKTFGRAGLGLFPAPAGMHASIAEQFNAAIIGVMHGVKESWYAISTHRRVQHPAIALIQTTDINGLAAGE